MLKTQKLSYLLIFAIFDRKGLLEKKVEITRPLEMYKSCSCETNNQIEVFLKAMQETDSNLLNLVKRNVILQ